MSGPVPQEHSHLKVLHDFQYKTAEDREIIIKKNERLYLLQKTNDDWWQVVRNLEQRSFYVPATYVRELSKSSGLSSTRKNAEEDRDNIFEPPQNLSYKSMPRESSNAMRNVKKWLAGAIDSKLEPSKTFYCSEGYQQTDVGDGGLRIHANVEPMGQKTKSLERELRPEHISDREEDGSHGSPRSRESVGYHKNFTKMNRLSTSPKNIGLQFRMEPSLENPFRRELESSLDRRNLGGKIGPRVRTRSSNSEGGHVNSETGSENRETLNKSDKEIFEKSDGRKINMSVNEEQRRDSESSSGNTRNSRSLDLEGNKYLNRRDRSTSPKPSYSRQMTAGSGSTGYHDDKSTTVNCDPTDISMTSGDHKILNDKRRTWAVDELMSELTQMCKERVVNKKPGFQLKSAEMKANFDPIEKLTREIHEMNRLRTDTNSNEIIDPKNSHFNGSPINVCKIAINTERTTIGQRRSSEMHHEIDDNVIDVTEQFETVVKVRGMCPSVSQNDAELTKPVNLPKSPKILDEYNEANILNDCNSLESSLNASARSLSSDKQSAYQKRENSVDSIADNSVERCCYSNVKINSEKVKIRPKLKIITMEPTAELRLTPSLEKLASEIQFLPAKRTSRIEDVRKKSIGKDDRRETDDGNFEEASKSDDSFERRSNREILKNRLDYKGSFKTKREGMYTQRDSRDIAKKSGSIGLKKSCTLHCATIPDCYRRFRRNVVQGFETLPENVISKRRSRSLSDLDIVHANNLDEEKNKMIIPRIPRCKPIPLPRTKLPGLRNIGNSSIEKINEKFPKFTKTNDIDLSVPRTIPQQRKISREKCDYSRGEETHFRGLDHNSYNLHSYGGYANNFDGNNVARNVNIESSTAVGFKTLLCASDSGSDNCLQSKELLSSLTENFTDPRSLRPAVKSRSSVNFNDGDRIPNARESLSDEQILSSNASSEALHSQSESELTATTLETSSQANPGATSEQDAFECAAISLPPGWIQKYDSDTGQICFLNERGNKWFSSNDVDGKIYFFEENSNESSWSLPAAHPDGQSLSTSSDGKNDKINVNVSSTSEPKDSETTRPGVLGDTSIVSRDLPTKKPGIAGGDWPHLYDGNNMLVLKEGIINRTKITENGKKLRKNWSTSYAVLTELFLLFFKDAKTFTMMKMGQSSMAKPDISVDLNGALVEHGDRASSRKNVYMISTVLGLQVLIQSDNTAIANEWFHEVHEAIRKLPSGFKSRGKLLSIAAELRINSGNKQIADANQSEDSKRFSKVARSRSMKMKRLDDSLEDLSGSPAERQTKIKAKLRWFFQRRPAVELLVKNGIYKDEPAFGSYLSDVCPSEAPRVPLFVKTCIEVLESKEENMKTDGLYRASGNLSQIQKIRLQVDQYKLDVLGQEEDVHVLTGALKLFFRELKEPLIPSSFFKEAVSASMLKKSSAKIQCFRDIVKALPPPNYDTLQFLLNHLLRVTSYQEFNRMHIPNLAIVFGPTLMWNAEESANMALDFMQQNLVIECLLSEYNKIFK